MESHFSSIWSTLKAEVLPGSNKDVTFAALNTLQELIKNVAIDKDLCNNILTPIFETIVEYLADVDARLFIPSTAVALVCARGNPIAAKVVTNKVLPIFLTQIRINSEKLVQRCTLIDFVTKFLVICVNNGNLMEMIETSIIDTVQRELLLCLLDTETNLDLIVVGFSSLTKICTVISKDNRLTIYEAINKHLNQEDGIVDVKPILSAFAKSYADEVREKVVNPLLTDTDFSKNVKISNKIFESLCTLTMIPCLSDEILKFIFKTIFDATSMSQLIALNNLRELLETIEPNELLKDLSNKYNIVDQFVKFVHSTTLNSDSLYQISIILRLVVRSLDSKSQQEIVKSYLASMNLQNTQDLYLTSGILGFLEESIDLEDHFDHIVTELTQLALISTDTKLVQIAHHLLCSLLNKADDSVLKKSVLKRTIDYLKVQIEKNDKKAVEVLSWIAKGLLARGHPDAAELVESVIIFILFTVLCNAF